MRPAPSWLLLFALTAAVPAWAQQPAPPKEVPTPAPVEPVHPEARPQPPDTRRAEPPLTDEDREVVENLELLESLDAAADLEVLLELADEQ
ncbi:hypothetical protein [Corallococcus caeni]|uniref:Uncharacterized protein n=1 Tax=Corallococcus caeni TaxID=3082388 RepID=A0ABQ6QJY5_9BACT|nr:hypothetical protein ASNO1_05770 [Corallococcus sp. NO1]